MSSQRGHRVISPGLPLAVLGGLFAFAALIRWLQGLPNPGYAERVGDVQVVVEGLPRSARAMQLRSRCGSEVVDNQTVTGADFRTGGEAMRLLPMSSAGECYVEARQLPAEGDFVGAPVGEGSCRVQAAPLGVSCS